MNCNRLRRNFMSRFTTIDERTGEPYTYIPYVFVFPSGGLFKAMFLFADAKVDAKADAEAQAKFYCTAWNVFHWKDGLKEDELASIIFLGTIPEFQEWEKTHYCAKDETFRERMSRNGEK
jgi:hypothetical protein